MTTTRRPGTSLLVVLVVVGTAAAVVTAVAGFVLADVYRPHPSSGFLSRAPGEVRRSAHWSDRHLWAGVALLAVAVLLAGLAAWRRSMLVVACAVVAASTALVALVTRELVAWDQLALRSVTVGSDVDGYWTAAFGHDVLFVLVGGSEVSQRTYGALLFVHLGAPVVAAVVLVVAAFAVLRTRRGGDAPEPVAAPAGTAAA